MIYYTYDHVTGAYTGLTGEAHPCQIEDGVFHLPAWATYEVPPSEVGSTAYFKDGAWTLHKDPTPEEILEALGRELTPQQKVEDLLLVAGNNVDHFARILGFKDSADALSYTGTDTVRGVNADEFKQWRAQVMDRVDALVARHKDSSQPMPSHHDWNMLFEGIQFKVAQNMPEVTVSSAAEWSPEPDALLLEASRIEELIKTGK